MDEMIRGDTSDKSSLINMKNRMNRISRSEVSCYEPQESEAGCFQKERGGYDFSGKIRIFFRPL
jgi:hypothetical protein